MNDDKEAVYRLMNEYCYSLDRSDFDGFSALFEHGSFQVIGDPSGPCVGRQAVRKFLQNVILYDGKTHAKHVMSNVQIDVDESGNEAKAQCYLIVFQALPPDFPMQPIFGGHYYDHFEKHDGDWRFKSRDISPDLVGDLSRHRDDLA